MYNLDDMYRKADYQEFIAREMYERRKKILKESSNVVGQDYAEEILKLIVAAHAEDMPEADIFIKHLNLTEKDLHCITDDIDKYQEVLAEEDMEMRIAYSY